MFSNFCRERQEITELKRRIAELEDLVRVNDRRANLQQDRARKRIADLSRRNQELEEEFKVLQSSMNGRPNQPVGSSFVGLLM